MKIKPKTVLIWAVRVLVMALACRARIAGGMAPFAYAFYAAMRVSGADAAMMLPAVALGCIASPAGLMGLHPIVGCAVIELLARAAIAKKLEADARACLMAFLGAATPGFMFSYGIVYNMVSALLLAVAACAVAPVLRPFYAAFERDSGGDEALSVAAAVVIASLGLAGTPAQRPFMAFAISVCASRGVGAGSAAGLVAGVMTLFTGGRFEAVAVMGVAGLAAGLVAPCSRFMPPIAFFTACAAFALGEWEFGTPVEIWEAGVGSLICLALPERAVRAVARLGEGERRNLSERRLRSLAGAFDELSKGYALDRKLKDEDAALAAMRASLCEGCPGRSECFAGDNTRATRTLLMIFGGVIPLTDDPPPSVRRVCRRAARMKEALSPVIREFEGLRRWNVKRSDGLRLIGRQFAHARDALLLASRGAPETAARPRLRARVGAAARARESVSGDSHRIIELDSGRILVAVCDGMGTGEAARRQSERAITIITRLIASGDDELSAIEIANTLILMRGDEAFSTVDLGIIDLVQAEARLYKLAAPPTIHLRGSEARSLEGGRLPIGVVEDARPAVSSVGIKPGDMLFFASDGVTDALDDELIADIMRAGRENPPKTVCEAVLRRAASARDDQTCVCVAVR